MEAAVVDDGARLIVIDVGMALQLVERQAVKVDLVELRVVGDDKECEGALGEILNLQELLDAVIAAQAVAVFHYLPGEIGAYARHFAQLCRIGSVQYDTFVGLKLDGVPDGVALLYGFIVVEMSVGRHVLFLDADEGR